MRKAKKILCAVLAAAMLLSSMPMSTFAAEADVPSSPAQTAEPSAEPAGEVVPEEVPPAAADPAEAVDATGPPAETAEPSASPAPEATAAPSAEPGETPSPEPTEAPSAKPEAEVSEDHGIATIWYREFDGQLLTSGQNGLTSSTPNNTATFGYVGEILTRYMAAGSTDTSNGTAAYCVQQGVETNFPTDYMQGSIGSYYRSDIADIIGDILTAGYATDNAAVDLAEGQTANASRWAATQIALWEATRYGVTAETWHTVQSNADALTVLSGAPIPSVAQSEYNSIIAAVVGKRVKPSFDGDSVTLTWDGEKYTATLTDRNNVLSEYDYSAAGFTFQKSGNQLTVSTDAVHESPVTATATHNVVGGSGQAVLWVGSMSNPSLQRIVSYAGTFSSTPVTSTFTVKTEAMLTVHLTKTSADVSISGQNSAYSLEGAEYGVYSSEADAKADRNQTAKFVTNAAGKAEVNLKPGVYYVKELKAPKGFVLSDTVHKFNVTSTSTTFDVQDDPSRVQITVRKKDAETGTSAQGDATLAGAVYRISYTQNGESVQKDITTDASGVARLGKIPLGKITVQEITAPKGYKLDGTVHTYTVTATDRMALEYELEPEDITDAVIKGKVQLQKKAEQADGSTKPEQGAVFEVFLKSAGSYDKAKETERDLLTTNGTGTAVSKELPYGVYTVHQRSGGSSYMLADDFEVNISKDAETYNYEITNRRKSAQLKIVKTSEDGIIEGLRFRVTRISDNWTKEYTTDAHGVILTEALPLFEDDGGKTLYRYKVEEISTPDRYVQPAAQTVTLKADGIAEVQFSNVLKKFTFTLKKTDAQTGDTPQGGATLAGAVFGLFKGENKLDEYTVGADGTFTSKEYVCGEGYTVREIRPPKGYLLSDTVYKLGAEPGNFTVEHSTLQVTATNEVIRGGVLIEKRDAETGLLTPQGAASLDGTQFEIRNLNENPVTVGGNRYGKNEVVMTVTVKDGVAQTAKNALPYGHYSWKEVKVGAGYLLTDGEAREFDISANGQIVEFRDDKAAKNRVIRGGVLLEKRDAETGLLTPQGAASLDGTQFEIRNLSDNPVIVNGESYEKDAVVLTVTVKDGVAQTAADALPYGHYSWKEIKVGTGYLLTDGEAREFDIREDGKLVEYREDNAAHNQVIRGDIDFIKVAEDDMHRLVHVPFRLTSETTGESHILITDENGYASTEADWNPHTADTNCNDDKLESGEYNLKSGVWFGADAKVNDGLGALPFDTYTLEELRCEANAEYDLITVKGITVSRNTRTVHLGTIDDRYVPQPEIWTAAHGEDGGKTLFEDEQAILVDVLTYTNLPKRELVVRGVVMDKATGKPLMQNGEQVTAEQRVTPRLSEGSVEMEYTLDTTGLGGHDLVVYEYVYEKDGKTVIAEHADLEDLDQTVTVVPPEIGTTAYVGEGEDKTGYVSEDITIRDIVHYKGLTPGKPVRVEGVLMDKASGDVFLVDGQAVTSTVTFTPEKSEGDVEVTFVFNGVKAIQKSTDLVVFESMYHEDEETPFVVHTDLEDEGQTVTIVPPEIGTTAYAGDGNDKTGYVSETVTIRDIVHYKGLTPGKPVRVEGVLMDKASGKEFLVDGKAVTSTVTFTPEKSEGDVEVTFVFNGVKAIQKSTDLVVFESMYHEDEETPFVVHTDLEDEGQTVTIVPPEIGTTAYVGEGKDKTGYVSETVTIRDIVHYKGLTPGKEVRVEGVLMDKSSGEAFLVDGKPVTASAKFTPEKPEGDIEVTFVFNGVKAIQKSTDLVVFESMYHEDEKTPFVVHKDLEDEGQTVTIFPPEIGTTAYVGEGEDKTGYVSEDITIRDIVHYKGLTPGKPVRVEGTLMDKSSGEAFLVNGKPVTSSVTFTPEKPEGDVEVTFVFNGVKAIQKSTDLVVFESMYHDGEETPFVVHTDLEDEAQTVTVEPISGTIRVTKTNADRPEEKLSGAKFSVYLDVDENGKYDEDVDTPIDLLKETKEKGVYSLTGLGFGKYLLHEEKAPEGFTADEKYYPFEITENGVTVDVENAQGHGFTNIPNYSGVRVVKTNAAKPEERLTGAKFAVYRDKNGNGKYDGDADAPVDMLQETEKGVYTLNTLRKGKYLLHKEAAPEGFIRDENYYPFEIKEEGEGVTVENEQGKGFTNQPVTPPTETPQTGDNSNLGFWIGLGATAIGALAALLLLYLRKKRDRE